MAELSDRVGHLGRKLASVERLAILPNFEIPSADAVVKLSDIERFITPETRVLIKADIDVARRRSPGETHFKLHRLASTINQILPRGANVVVLAAQGLTSVELLENVNRQDLEWHRRALADILGDGISITACSSLEEAHDALVKDPDERPQVTFLPNLIDLSPEDILYPGIGAPRPSITEQAKALRLSCENSTLVRALEPLYDIFVLDDFRSTVWQLPSNVGLASNRPGAIGVGLEADLSSLERLVARCIEVGRKGDLARLCICGSSRPEDIEVVEAFLDARLFDQVLLGPTPSLLVYEALGNSLPHGIRDDLEHLVAQSSHSLSELLGRSVHKVLTEYRDKIVLPTDYVVADRAGRKASKTVEPHELRHLGEDDRIMTIGPLSVDRYLEAIGQAGMVFHFGMIGSSHDPYHAVTEDIISAHLRSGAEVFMAGDHILEIAHDLGLADRLAGSATGAHTTSAYMTGAKLPGLVPFIRRES